MVSHKVVVTWLLLALFSGVIGGLVLHNLALSRQCAAMGSFSSWGRVFDCSPRYPADSLLIIEVPE